MYCIAGTFGEGKVWQIDIFGRLAKNVRWISRSAKRLLIVSTKLDGFSLVDHWRLTKFAELSLRQTFPLYIMAFLIGNISLQACSHKRLPTNKHYSLKLWESFHWKVLPYTIINIYHFHSYRTRTHVCNKT